MRKYALLSSLIALASHPVIAQAATVYDQDDTRLDVYGRIHYVVTSGGPQSTAPDAAKSSGSDFVNKGSRFGFRASHRLDDDTRLFANLELRFDPTAQNRDPMSVRNSFLGAQHRRFGTVTLGNFDSVYKQAVTNLFGEPDYADQVTLDSGEVGSRGDSLAYASPSLAGFRAHAQVKHASGNGATAGEADNGSALTAAAAVSYSREALYLAAGYNQSRDLSERGASYGGGGNNRTGEDLWGVAAQYAFSPTLSARIIHERVGSVAADARATDIESLWGLGGTFRHSLGKLYGQIYRVSAVGDEIDTHTQWVLGGTYRFSQPMYAYLEVIDYNAQAADVDNGLLYAVGVRYDF